MRRPLACAAVAMTWCAVAGARPSATRTSDAVSMPETTSRQRPTESCAPIHWVETWDGRLFMKVHASEPIVERTAAAAPAPKPIDDRFNAWGATLPNRVIGSYRVGARFAVYHTGDGEAQACTVTRFTMLTRGTPHFAWFGVDRSKEFEPKTPGCGSAELFAELSCPGVSGAVSLATPAGTPGPMALEQSYVSLDAERVTAALKKGFTYQRVRQEAVAAAKERNEPLQEEVSLEIYEGTHGLIAVATIMFMTADGMVECGHEDVRVTVRGVAAVSAKGEVLEVLAPFEEVEDSTLQGLFDIDGEIHLLETLFPQRTRLAPLRGAGKTCEIAVEYCDCPC